MGSGLRYCDSGTVQTIAETHVCLHFFMSRLTRLKDAKGVGVLFDRQYSYNAANQISQITEPTLTRILGYDNADRLTSMANGAAGLSGLALL